jgi:hypothetical protein
MKYSEQKQKQKGREHTGLTHSIMLRVILAMFLLA